MRDDVSPDDTSPHAPRRRSFLKRVGALGAAAVGLPPALAACSAGPESTNDTGDGGSGKDRTLTAVIGYGNDGSWDPTQTASAFAMAANHHIYEGLLDTDPITRVPYPALATALPGDPSATTWRFTLRSGATFHDGRPVTADDVAFVFDRILDPKTQTLAKGFFAPWLDSVRTVDARTVELRLKFPFPDGLARLTLAKVMPQHVFSRPGAWDDAVKGLAVGSGAVPADRAPPEVEHHLRSVRRLQRAPQARVPHDELADDRGRPVPRREDLRDGRGCADRRQHPLRQHSPAGAGRAEGRRGCRDEQPLPDVQHPAQALRRRPGAAGAALRHRQREDGAGRAEGARQARFLVPQRGQPEPPAGQDRLRLRPRQGEGAAEGRRG